VSVNITRFRKIYRYVSKSVDSTWLQFIYFLYGFVLYRVSKKFVLSCRNNATKKSIHQMIDEGTEAERTRSGRNFLSRGHKTIVLHIETRACHQNINKEGFHPASNLWRYRSKHNIQNVIPTLGRNL
jgi:hypothetical protein